MSEKTINAFTKGRKLSKESDLRSGISTGDNNIFYRLWYECIVDKISFDPNATPSTSTFKWFPIIKGGENRKWFGNQEYVINLENEGYEIKNSGNNFRLRTPDFYNKKGITWSRISSSTIAFRIKTEVVNFGENSPVLFISGKEFEFMAVLNSKLTTHILAALNPTLSLLSK